MAVRGCLTFPSIRVKIHCGLSKSEFGFANAYFGWTDAIDASLRLQEFHKAIETYKKALELDENNAEAQDGITRTRAAIATSMGDEERAQHGMADPEVQAIMMDPIMRQVLNDFQSDPQAAQR